jgi:hypothetical protein
MAAIASATFGSRRRFLAAKRRKWHSGSRISCRATIRHRFAYQANTDSPLRFGRAAVSASPDVEYDLARQQIQIFRTAGCFPGLNCAKSSATPAFTFSAEATPIQ